MPAAQRVLRSTKLVRSREYHFWSIAGTVTQPIFHGGTLLFHQELAARDAFDQAAAQYRSTVVVAFQNVADVP